MAVMSERTNIRLDAQARDDAQRIADHYNLRSVSAAVRYALRDAARRLDGDKVSDTVTPGAAAGDTKKTGQGDTAP